MRLPSVFYTPQSNENAAEWWQPPRWTQMARRTVLVVLALCAAVSGGKGRGGNGKWRAKQEAKAPEPKPEGFEGIECKKCMSAVMRLLVPANRGCPAGNGTVIPSSSPLRAPPAFCDTELPKRRKCVTYSFGISGAWDFDKAMVARGCRVISFDPTCCGAAHRVQENHDFVPIGLATYDGLADSDDPAKPNMTIPVLTMKTIMESYEHNKIDVLRLKVSTNKEWKGLKNLVNTGVIQEVGQLSLNVHLSDDRLGLGLGLGLGFGLRVRVVPLLPHHLNLNPNPNPQPQRAPL